MYDFIYYQVRDVMTADPVTVGEDVPLKDAEKIFEKHDFNGLPVVDPEGRLTGMVTKLDLLKTFVFTDKVKVPPYQTLMSKSIATVMTRDLKILDPETPLTRVLQLMIDTRNKSFPVVENGRLAGIIAREDVLRALHQASEGRLPARMMESSA